MIIQNTETKWRVWFQFLKFWGHKFLQKKLLQLADPKTVNFTEFIFAMDHLLWILRHLLSRLIDLKVVDRSDRFEDELKTFFL